MTDKAARLKANRKLLKILAAIVEVNPDQRFGQILRNYDFIRDGAEGKNGEHLWFNHFNVESDVTLDAVRKAVDKMGWVVDE